MCGENCVGILGDGGSRGAVEEGLRNLALGIMAEECRIGSPAKMNSEMTGLLVKRNGIRDCTSTFVL